MNVRKNDATNDTNGNGPNGFNGGALAGPPTKAGNEANRAEDGTTAGLGAAGFAPNGD